MWERVVAACLGLGLLPALVGLSPALHERGLAFHSLKWGAPLLGAFVWSRRALIPRSAALPALLFFFVGAVSLWPAWVSCEGSPAFFLREAAVVAFASLGAFAFFLLEPVLRRRVLDGWMALLLFALVIDLFFPVALNALYRTLFSPGTRALDYAETFSVSVWAGFWGRQSYGKLLAWVPFLWLAERGLPRGALRRAFVLALAVFVPLLSLGTSQRGALLGACAGFLGSIAFGAFHSRTPRVRKAWGVSLVALLFACLLALAVVPRSLWGPRLQSVVQLIVPGVTIVDLGPASGNLSFRGQMLDVTLRSIRESPLGNPCIPLQAFRRVGLWSKGHAHHLFLQPIRERGWAFGALHAFLWLFGGVLLWNAGRTEGAAVRSAVRFGAWTTIVIAGMADYSWFTLHQALPMSIVLWMPYWRKRERAG